MPPSRQPQTPNEIVDFDRFSVRGPEGSNDDVLGGRGNLQAAGGVIDDRPRFPRRAKRHDIEARDDIITIS
jgi:hypothetical protein